MYWFVTVRRTTIDIRRMLKSVAWTVNCPMTALAVQAGPGTSPLPLEMAYSATPPEMVLFREFIRSGSTVSRERKDWLVRDSYPRAGDSRPCNAGDGSQPEAQASRERKWQRNSRTIDSRPRKSGWRPRALQTCRMFGCISVSNTASSVRVTVQHLQGCHRPVYIPLLTQISTDPYYA
jgi:hypothetical protein